ncbi:ABC transporter substrate binding protein [Ruminiclostridium cellobioparum]|uniref:ABC transporter substrate binding protein n=1 Tax=Ruminiclostridium cellobioparum TaxID=29355 RepID=UPI0028B01B91|nr:ABC transporter substrate binding protein [Ruminiclostridium cellobioparum]
MDVKRSFGIGLKLLIFTFLTLFILPGFSTYANNLNKKNILIINSYSEGLSWTKNESDGILDTLEEAGEMFDISVEYMDWKTYPSGENLKYLHNYMKYKYYQRKIDVIISTDDAALKFALDNRAELFDNAPVVFCGVNPEGVSVLTSGKENITGVAEKVDAEGTIKAALGINPELKEIYVVFDNSESGISTWELINKAAAEVCPYIRLVPLNSGNYTAILNRAGDVGKDGIILMTTYYSDTDGNTLGFEKFTEMVCQASKVPVYHLYEFGLGHGVAGGSMLSGRVQGELAGKMALRVLNGENISDIPVYMDKTTQYMFDYKVLGLFNIKTSLVPRRSIIINNPYSVFSEYKNFFISASIIIVLLSGFIIILLFYLRRINKIKRELADSNSELSQLYEELTASDEELRIQYDELTEMQKNLVQSETRYRQLYEKMLNGYVVFEPVLDRENKIQDIRFIEYNQSYLQQMKASVSISLGQTWTEVFGTVNRNQPVYLRVLLTGETEQFEAHDAKNNQFFLVNAFKLNENQIGVVFENITNYKSAIREIRKLNEELEERVQERTQELQSAVSQLESFTYTVSHDLKSPLRAVDSYIRIIMEDYGRTINRDAAGMLTSVRNISKEMMEMINKLLLYTTASRSELNFEEVNSEDLFLACFNEMKAAYPDRNIDLIIETGLPNVTADRILLKQVINNILSNAFKFTKGREKAQIRIGSALTEKEYTFYVRDNGIGFDMSYSGKLYGIFQRLHTSDEFEGSGIGLVTIKKIIEKHGGSTWIEGTQGVGATIYFTLPYIEKNA